MTHVDDLLYRRRCAVDAALADYDPKEGTERMASRVVQEALLAELTKPAIPSPAGRGGTVDDQRRAAADLERECYTTVSDPGSGKRLAAFSDHYAADGAHTFACLLYLIGRASAAAFWWRFAAGADHAGAMHALELHLYAEGDVVDSNLWAKRLLEIPHPPLRSVPGWAMPTDPGRIATRAKGSIRDVEDDPVHGEICLPKEDLPLRVERATTAALPRPTPTAGGCPRRS